MNMELKNIQKMRTMTPSQTLPDISQIEKTQFAGRLSRVGMSKIEMPVLFAISQGKQIMLPAEVKAFVSLDDPQAKGIHMSRLYLALKNSLPIEPLNSDLLKNILNNFISTHTELSESAFIEIEFKVPMERKALVSGELGYRHYPVKLQAHLKNGKFDFVFSTEVLYSSTCPCSAALAKQIMRNEFANSFLDKEVVAKQAVMNWLEGQESTVAFPHAQRSVARVSLRYKNGASPHNLDDLVNLTENALGTPVQAAVKRADEQEFARLNASNLMFCEDAARKLRNTFEKLDEVLDYHIYVEHQESLHPHDAVSVVVKGIAGGFTP